MAKKVCRDKYGRFAPCKKPRTAKGKFAPRRKAPKPKRDALGRYVSPYAPGEKPKKTRAPRPKVAKPRMPKGFKPKPTRAPRTPPSFRPAGSGGGYEAPDQPTRPSEPGYYGSGGYGSGGAAPAIEADLSDFETFEGPSYEETDWGDFDWDDIYEDAEDYLDEDEDGYGETT